MKLTVETDNIPVYLSREGNDWIATIRTEKNTYRSTNVDPSVAIMLAIHYMTDSQGGHRDHIMIRDGLPTEFSYDTFKAVWAHTADAFDWQYWYDGVHEALKQCRANDVDVPAQTVV